MSEFLEAAQVVKVRAGFLTTSVCFQALLHEAFYVLIDRTRVGVGGRKDRNTENSMSPKTKTEKKKKRL